MKIFLDTSEFAKRYVDELGSAHVLQLCDQATSLVVSVICLPELISTLSRLVREKRLSKRDYQRLKQQVLGELADVDVCQVTPEILALVVELLELYPLRAMDAFHIAGAKAVDADIFVSADHRQIIAAKGAGLKVVDVSTA